MLVLVGVARNRNANVTSHSASELSPPAGSRGLPPTRFSDRIAAQGAAVAQMRPHRIETKQSWPRLAAVDGGFATEQNRRKRRGCDAGVVDSTHGRKCWMLAERDVFKPNSRCVRPFPRDPRLLTSKNSK